MVRVRGGVDVAVPLGGADLVRSRPRSAVMVSDERTATAGSCWASSAAHLASRQPRRSVSEAVFSAIGAVRRQPGPCLGARSARERYSAVAADVVDPGSPAKPLANTIPPAGVLGFASRPCRSSKLQDRASPDGGRTRDAPVAARGRALADVARDRGSAGRARSRAGRTDLTAESAGRIDVLVANAGVVADAVLGDHTEENVDLTLAVNVKGPLFTVQKALRCWRRTPPSWSSGPATARGRTRNWRSTARRRRR